MIFANHQKGKIFLFICYSLSSIIPSHFPFFLLMVNYLSNQRLLFIYFIHYVTKPTKNCFRKYRFYHLKTSSNALKISKILQIQVHTEQFCHDMYESIAGKKSHVINENFYIHLCFYQKVRSYYRGP